MKLNEFNAILDSISKDQEEIYAKAQALFDAGIYDLNKYIAIGAHNIKGTYLCSQYSMLKKDIVMSDNLNDFHSIDDLVEELIEFKELKKDNLNKIGISETTLHENIVEDYIDELDFRYDYYTLSEEKLKSKIQRLSREKVRELLKPDSEDFARTPDCAIVKLYREEKIDWKTLQKITYSDCDL